MQCIRLFLLQEVIPDIYGETCLQVLVLTLSVLVILQESLQAPAGPHHIKHMAEDSSCPEELTLQIDKTNGVETKAREVPSSI